ncbi:Basic proline-rich protein [Acidisarcina polymorpha]|uniref:Basic proline-rich protein n=1 Tax=Acidisarcina polymorpha TaxID=2211140 RepID=A0A2Z5G5L3_9BACT|nr:DUF6600 domain-containing protein [Acidisarcina polymorpha]AXC14381.1 Basic proline-rich protein [Acidisarcina polymorpha]
MLKIANINKTSTLRGLAVITAAAPFFLAAALFAQDNSQAALNDPPALVARIGYTQGDVSFMAAGTTEWAAGVNNYPMTSGDRLYCDQNSRAEIGAGSTDIRMGQSTDVTLTNLTDQYEQIGLAAGSIRVRIYGLNPGSTVEVDTPNGSAIITQPGDYRFDAFSGDGGSDAIVNAGAVQITGPEGLNQEVTAGQAVQMTGTDPITIYPVGLPAFDALDQWSINRDHDILNSQSAQYVSRETPGFSDLDANGSWAPTPDYGPVWYPSSVPSGWRPYSLGHWAYVAPWGYTWIDDAAWGYAPFHYGRWASIQGRWGWVPGPPAVVPVYSPALVAFVGGPGISIGIGIGGGGGGVAAWFPLGVGEPFVPWYHASPAYARQVNVTNVNITNIHNTTIVNNYNTYITNTRTVNNINQINTNNIQYAHRAQVTAVPVAAMSSGRPVTQAAVKLTPAMQQQLAAAPVHAAPPAPAPSHPLLVPKQNVAAPAARPTLVTPRGLAKATPAANPARLAPVNLPKPQPATSLPKPVPGAVAGRPATAQPPAAKAAALKSAPGKPAVSPQPKAGTSAAAPEPAAKTPVAKPTSPAETTSARPGQPTEKAPAPVKTQPETPAARTEAPPKAAPAQRPATERPATPETPRPEENSRPQEHPAPAKETRPAAAPATHPAPPAAAHPQAKPTPKPAPKPAPQKKEDEDHPR